MYCKCSSITLHSKLYMSSLLIFIIVNVMFYLFYLQVEPVYLRVSNKCYPNHFCVFNIGNIYNYVIVNMVQFTLVDYIIIYYHLASFMPSSIDIIITLQQVIFLHQFNHQSHIYIFVVNLLSCL